MYVYNEQVFLVFQQQLQMASRRPYLKHILNQRLPYSRLQDLWVLAVRVRNIYIRLVARYHQLLQHETDSGLNRTLTATAPGLV